MKENRTRNLDSGDWDLKLKSSVRSSFSVYKLGLKRLRKDFWGIFSINKEKIKNKQFGICWKMIVTQKLIGASKHLWRDTLASCSWINIRSKKNYRMKKKHSAISQTITL